TILFISLILYNASLYEETMPLRLCIPAAQAAIAEYENEEERIQFLRGYRRGALQATIGLTYTYSSLDKENTPYARGYRSGKAHIEERAKTKQFMSLSEFGYQPVALEGILRLGFEQSHFTPKGHNRPYWIVFPDFIRSQIPEGTRPDGKSVTVKGWLSPRGIYGHMGRSTYELIVLEISENTRQTEQDASPERR
ncbi:MAG: hypothetical protein ACE5NM_10520, partial [Sedimentisphaerales bacterium]